MVPQSHICIYIQKNKSLISVPTSQQAHNIVNSIHNNQEVKTTYMSINDWMDFKKRSKYIQQYYLVIKGKEIPSPATTW